MQINTNSPVDTSYQLKGGMKVSNDSSEIKDTFTPSDRSAVGDFLHNIGDKIKYMFVKDGTPEKEGAYVPSSDGKGMVWCEHPDPAVYEPLERKTDGGCFCLKVEACAPDVFYWRPYMDPENKNGPYGMGGHMWKDSHIVTISNPDPKDFATGGKWHLDTACGGFGWWWHPDKPQTKPEPPINYEI